MSTNLRQMGGVSYWRGVCRSLQRSDFLKQADMGGESGDSQSFESAFSNLAHAYLKDKAPQLLDFMLGFQLLEKNEDNDRAVGVFGFKVGPQLIYAPVFFLNGELRGHELMYLKESDTFVPLKENWVNYVLNRKPNVIGEEVTRNLSMLGVSRPSLDQFRESPNKYASDQWLDAGMPGLMHALGRVAKREPKAPELIKASAAVATRFLQVLDSTPQLARPIVENYGRELVDEAIGVAKTASTVCPTEPPRKKRDIQVGGSIFREKSAMDQAKEADPINTGSLRIWTYNGTKACRRGLTEKQAEQLQRDGVYIKDDRYDKSKVYKVQEPMTLQNPDETGHYDVLCKPDSFEKCLYIHAPHGPRGRKPNGVLVRVGGDKKAYTEVHPGDIYVIEKYSGSDYNDWFNGLPNADSLQVGATYALLTTTGHGTSVFEVEDTLPSEGEEKRYKVRWRHYGNVRRRADKLIPSPSHGHYEWDNTSSVEQIVLNRIKGHKLVSRLDELLVPPGAKALKIADPPKDEDGDSIPGCCNPCADSSDPPALVPGDHVDLQLGIYKTSSALEVFNNGTEAIVNGRHSTPKAALISLVRDYGCAEKTAKDVLKNAQLQRGVKYRIKYAQPYDLLSSAPSAPAIPEQYESTDFIMGSGLPTNYGMEEEYPVDDLRGGRRQRGQMAEPPEPMMGQQLMEAAQTGQKEVLDTSLLSNLLKGSQNETLIDRHLPDLMKGLDSMGRLLFNMYWHHDKFEDRYGSNNLPELEDAMRNSFESLGDVTLELKQKTIEPYPDEGVDVDFGEGEV